MIYILSISDLYISVLRILKEHVLTNWTIEAFGHPFSASVSVSSVAFRRPALPWAPPLEPGETMEQKSQSQRSV